MHTQPPGGLADVALAVRQHLGCVLKLNASERDRPLIAALGYFGPVDCPTEPARPRV